MRDRRVASTQSWSCCAQSWTLHSAINIPHLQGALSPWPQALDPLEARPRTLCIGFKSHARKNCVDLPVCYEVSKQVSKYLFAHIQRICSNRNKSRNKSKCKTRRRSESAYIRQVHDNVMMYTFTRLDKHLPMYLRSRPSPANDNDVIDNDGCGVTGMSGKIHLKRCWQFCTFLHNPHFDFEPEVRHQKAKKGSFPTIYCPNGNIVNFSHMSRVYFC